MATILVTGGAGFVGSQACKALAGAGHVPVTFDNLISGERAFVRYGPFVEGDLNNAVDLERAFSTHHPDGVMHFAALSLVGESARVPGRYWRTNVGGTLNLLDAMLRHDVDAIIFSSSCAVYGEPESDLLQEDDERAPVSPYGQTKLAVERMLADFEAAHSMRHVIFRYFNAAGADPDGELGEWHQPPSHLIPIAFEAVLGRRDPVTIYGTDYPTPDGTCIRDYIHVVDLAEAHRLGMDYLLSGGESIDLNLGSGGGCSVRAVLDAIPRVTGHAVPHQEGSRRPGDPARLVSGSARASGVLGWNCHHSDLDTMIRDGWNWHRRRAVGEGDS